MSHHLDPRLAEHLRRSLGVWPPTAPVTVTSSQARLTPGWDGKVRSFTGLSTPEGIVLSVPAELEAAVRDVAGEWETPAFATDLAVILGRKPGPLDLTPLYRWSTSPADLPDEGEWVERDDPRVPAWLRVFNGGILIALDDEGAYGAGVGIKRHDDYAHEIAVGTEPSLRGRGIARRLVATAARRIRAAGAAPLYLHAASNTASAHVAEAAGFPDQGWRVVGFAQEDGDPDS